MDGEFERDGLKVGCVDLRLRCSVVYGVLSSTVFNDALCRRSKLPRRRRGGLLLGHDTSP